MPILLPKCIVKNPLLEKAARKKPPLKTSKDQESTL
jgi:hypothetical protein